LSSFAASIPSGVQVANEESGKRTTFASCSADQQQRIGDASCACESAVAHLDESFDGSELKRPWTTVTTVPPSPSTFPTPAPKCFSRDGVSAHASVVATAKVPTLFGSSLWIRTTNSVVGFLRTHAVMQIVIVFGKLKQGCMYHSTTSIVFEISDPGT
jgi:hypothetical protein